jgi:hypothetical protein
VIRDGYCYCCVAYLPVVESPWTEAHKDKVKQYKEEIFHKSLFLLFTPAFLSAQYDGIDVQQFSGIKHHGVPIVGLWVADHPEQQLLALIDGSHCPWCLDAFNAWHDLSAPLKTRSVSKMQESFKRAEQLHQAGRYREYINCLKACGHTCNFQSVGSPFPPIPNALWMLRFFRHGILSPEEMHDFSGLFMYIITAWKKCMILGYKAAYKSGPAYFVDTSFIRMPLFNGLPRFTKGLLHLKTFTAARCRILMKTLVCVMVDVFPQSPEWVDLTVSFLDYFTLAKQKSLVVNADLPKMLELMRRFSELAHSTLLPWSPSKLNFLKFHVLKHHVFFLFWFGIFANFSANVLEALHKMAAKDPWRHSSGMSQSQQVINYVVRHHTMQQHKKAVELLFPQPQESVNDEDMQAANEEPALVGARKHTKLIQGYIRVHTASTTFYQPAFKQFERCLRLYLHLIENQQRAVEGERSDLQWLPDLGKHQIVVRPTLKIPASHHEKAKFSPTVKSVTPKIHGSAEERFDNVACDMKDEENKEVEYIGQLLLLFTFTHNEAKHDAAFVWWYDILDKDVTTCHRVSRCYHTVPGVGDSVPHCQVLDATDVLYRAHLIPCCQEGNWGRSEYNFRLNRFIFSVP